MFTVVAVVWCSHYHTCAGTSATNCGSPELRSIIRIILNIIFLAAIHSTAPVTEIKQIRYYFSATRQKLNPSQQKTDNL